MKTINLLPKSVTRELQIELIASQVLSFWIKLLITLAVFFALVLASVLYLRSEITKTDHAIAEQKEILSSSNTKELQARVSALNKKIRTIKDVRNSTYYWSEALLELAAITPNELVIESLVIDRETGKIDITGTADNRDGVLTFWANVKKSRYFKNINFPLANLEKSEDTPYTYTFYINPEAIKHAITD